MIPNFGGAMVPNSAGSGIGLPVSGGIPNSTLFVGLTGNLAQDIIVFDAKIYGAKGDSVSVTGNVSIASGTGALTVTGATFATSDVGKMICVPGAGASGATLVTMISGRTSNTQVSLAANAGTTLSSSSQTVVYGTDDTTAIQNCINDAITAKGKVIIPQGRYLLSITLIISGACSIEGIGSFVNWGSVFPSKWLPQGNPVLNGTVIVQGAANTDCIRITASGVTVNLANFGIQFATPFTNTGSGIVVTPPAIFNYQNHGVFESNWENLKVYGHDGNHYAYDLTNCAYNRYASLHSIYGGGCVAIRNNSQIYSYGNSVFEDFYGNICVAPVAGGSSPPAFDGTSTIGNGSSPQSITLSTSKPNDVIILQGFGNGTNITSISDTAGLSWTRRAQRGSGSLDIEEWYALSSGVLTNDVITVSFSGGGMEVNAFGISGANFNSPFDSGGPVTSASAASMTTVNADAFVFGMARFGSTATPTVAGGWTGIVSGLTNSFFVSAYQQLTSTATKTIQTSNDGDINGSIIDAVYAGQALGSTGHGIFFDTSAFGNAQIIDLITWIRPQVWLANVGSEIPFNPPTSSQKFIFCTDATQVTDVDWVGRDFETNVSGCLAFDPIYANRIYGFSRAQMASVNPPTSPVSGTVYQNTTGASILYNMTVTLNPTVGAAASVVAYSDNTNSPTFVVGTASQPANSATGVEQTLSFFLPSGNYFKFVATNATLTSAATFRLSG